MKLSELIEKLQGLEDFDLKVVIRNETESGRPIYSEHDLTFEDIGYSSNKIILSIE